MKTKLIIENSEANIELTPENVFETDLMQKIIDNQEIFQLTAKQTSEYSYGVHTKFKLKINIKNIK